MKWLDLHTTITNVIGLTLIGVLASTLTSHWWSCAYDSADVFRAWLLGSVMFVVGSSSTIVLRHFGYNKHLQYYTELVLRIMIVYAIVTTALLKAEGHFYSYSLFDGQTKLADLEANSFANAFYGFSPMFQAYIGYAILLGLVLLSFRQTQRMGNLLLGGILINAVMLNISFESCFVFKNSIYLAVVAYFVLNDLPSYLTFFTKQQNIAENRYHPLTDNTHLHNSASLMKMILLVGLFYYNQDYIKDTKNYRSRNAESPITGVWQIIELKFFQEEIETQDKKTIKSFESIILDKGRYGAVKIADSLSFFEYLIVPDDNHLELWNFQDFYELDIKGRYTQINNDSMIYTGRNNKDSLTITMKRNMDSE